MSYIGNQPTSIAFLTDQFSGNGSTTAFTMSVAPANTSSILVAVTGVVQDPSTYSVAGTTLTFSAAPPSGTGNISVRYLGIPASGVTTTAYRTVTEFTATSGQTTFTPPSYTVGFINVYRNGVMLGSADFTASNGTTVVLGSGATTGDLITTESFYVSSVLNAIPATAGAVNSTYLAANLTLTTPTLSSPVTSGTPTGVGVLTSGTAVTSTSGTAINFTDIPSWVKRITVQLQGVSINSTGDIIIQFGTGATPTYTTSGYLGSSSLTSSGVGAANYTAGVGLYLAGVGNTGVIHGAIVLTLMNSSTNTWVAQGSVGMSDAARCVYTGSSVTLSGVATAIRITPTASNTFDAGSINILYE